MKILFIYGYLLGLTLASPITRFEEYIKGLRRVDNTENNGDRQEKTTYVQMKLHSGEILKLDPTRQPSLNDTISGIKVKKDESGVTNQTSSIEIRRSPIIKYQHKRNLNHMIQKLPKRRNNGKKHKPNKITQSHNAYNTSRKVQVNDMFKHKIEKGIMIKQLTKRSIDNDDTEHTSDPYHSPDISYDWGTQEDVTENDDDSQVLNESAGQVKQAEDFSSKSMNQNSDPVDSSESDHISTSESTNPRGSSESSSLVEPSESNSSNESSDDTESEEPTSDAANEPIVLTEAEDTHDSSENSAFTTPVSETTNGRSEYTLSSESGNQDDSSQSNEHNESHKSSDSSSNESSNSSDSNTSSHSGESNTHSEESPENSNHSSDNTVITDDIEENEIPS